MKRTSKTCKTLMAICLFLLISSLCFSAVGIASAKSFSANNVDFIDDFNSYAVGTKLNSLSSKGYKIFNSVDETIAVDPIDPTNKALRLSVPNRVQIELSTVLTQNFTASYRFYALGRIEWIGLNVRRQEQGAGIFYDASRNYLNLIRVGYNKKMTDGKTIHYSPQFYNRSAMTALDSESSKPSEIVLDSAYNSWHNVKFVYSDYYLSGYIDNELIFEIEYLEGNASVGGVSLLVQAGNLYLDDLKIITEDKFSVTVDNQIEAGSAKANRSSASEDSEIILQAKANDGFTFDGWYENNELLTKEPFYKVVGKTSANRIFTTKWIMGVYRLKISSLDSDRGTQIVSDGGDGVNLEAYSALTPLTLTANADIGYKFAAWYRNGEIISVDNPYNFKMSIRDDEIFAKYAPLTANLSSVTISAQTNEGVLTEQGSFSQTIGGVATGGGSYFDTITTKLKAEASDRYAFVGWFIGDELLSNELQYIVTINGDQNYIAKFKNYDYKITIYNGVTAEKEEFTSVYGSLYTIEPKIASLGYVFRDWHIENTTPLQFEDGKIQFKVQKDNIIVRANYQKNIHNVKVTTNISGVGGTGGGNKNFGETVTIKAMEKNGYILKSYKITGAAGNLDKDGILSFSMPDNDVTIQLEFIQIKPIKLTYEIIGRVAVALLIIAVAAIFILRKKNLNK